MNKVACNWFGPRAVFHHAGIAVTSINNTGIPTPEIFEDPTQKVTVTFLDCYGCCIELIAPLAASSPVSQALRKGQKLLHLCFEVDNISDALNTAGDQGFKIIAQPVPSVAFEGRKIAWVYSLNFGLFELLEKCKSATNLDMDVGQQVAGQGSKVNKF